MQKNDANFNLENTKCLVETISKSNLNTKEYWMILAYNGYNKERNELEY